VQDPVKYAEVMTSLGTTDTSYTQDRIRHMIASGAETDIKFTTPIPVHITYQTAFVDDAGKLQFREDVYGRDATLIAALKSSERAPAREDIPMARQDQQPTSTASSSGGGRPRGSSRVAGGPQAYGNGGLFQMFFSSARPPAAIPGRRAYYR
jgi:hypothetical protein